MWRGWEWGKRGWLGALSGSPRSAFESEREEGRGTARAAGGSSESGRVQRRVLVWTGRGKAGLLVRAKAEGWAQRWAECWGRASGRGRARGRARVEGSR